MHISDKSVGNAFQLQLDQGGSEPACCEQGGSASGHSLLQQICKGCGGGGGGSEMGKGCLTLCAFQDRIGETVHKQFGIGRCKSGAANNPQDCI